MDVDIYWSQATFPIQYQFITEKKIVSLQEKLISWTDVGENFGMFLLQVIV